VRLRVPLHGYVLLSAFLTTFVFASRLASINALPHTFIVVEIWAWRISFAALPPVPRCRYASAALKKAFAGGGVYHRPIDYLENKRVLVDELAQRLPITMQA
jgi:hypothetical protein